MRILLLTTGGTIASAPGPDGLQPEISGEELLRLLGDLGSDIHMDVRQLFSLDSSNIEAAQWQTMAKAVWEALPDYDGVILTHGTDTMAYSASALSFMLQGVKKPIVLTGAQVPITSPLTDARNNLFCAIAAVEAGIPGVSVAFNRRIIRGCRAVKVRTMGFDAFESVNAQYLAEIFADGLRVYDADYSENAVPQFRPEISTDVFLLKLIPNTNPRLFDSLLQLGYRGLVLETFGAGGFNFENSALMDGLKKLCDAGVTVVSCSQCLYEPSVLTIYEVGRKLLDIGVIPAEDMTTEAAVTKLMWLIGQGYKPKMVRSLFIRNLAGELTENKNARE